VRLIFFAFRLQVALQLYERDVLRVGQLVLRLQESLDLPTPGSTPSIAARGLGTLHPR